MLEAERGFAFIRQGAPVFESALQQVGGSENVGFDEAERIVDGAVHMAFGGQMHDGVRLEVVEEAFDGCRIADVRLFEMIER